MRGLIASVLVVASITTNAIARTIDTVRLTCPLCRWEFDATIDKSGTQFDMRLDLKPLGPTPAPWLVPVCSKCRFVVYRRDIPDQELQNCRKIVASDEYRKHADRASYFLMGVLFERLGKSEKDTAHVFLKASWQEEQRAENFKECLERSLKHFHLYVTNAEKHDETWQTAQVLIGELLRRLGRFADAQQHLTKLAKMEHFQGNLLAKVVAYELELCRKQDSAPHSLSEIKQPRSYSRTDGPLQP
jgi:hypothetical protein